MPELVEVEIFKRQIEKSLKGKTIQKVLVHPDKLIFNNRSSAFIKKSFLGARIKRCLRKGKYIWFETDHDISPVFHLGMTGSYIIANKLPDKSIKSVKLVLIMDDGTTFTFKDPRRFGRIFLLNDPLQKRPLSNLGPDVLNELPRMKTMKDLLKKRKAPIKGVLLDQSSLSGIGNWMADEILFQSRIDPHKIAMKLRPDEIKKLLQKMRSVTNLAIRVGANPEKYPKTWLFHKRWGHKNNPTIFGHKIRYETVAGRTTAWVPEIQK